MLMKQQRLFTVVEKGENNIDRTSLFVIIIIVAHYPFGSIDTICMFAKNCGKNELSSDSGYFI